MPPATHNPARRPTAARSWNCRMGASPPKDYYVKEFAQNAMLQISVEDARAWYGHAATVLNSRCYDLECYPEREACPWI
jgi:hypothetical protein